MNIPDPFFNSLAQMGKIVTLEIRVANLEKMVKKLQELFDMQAKLNSDIIELIKKL